MGITKKINFDGLFIFLFFVAFPFGQIIRLSFGFMGMNVPLQPIDIIVASAGIYAIFRGFKKPQVLRYFIGFLSVALFSFILSCFIFKTPYLVYGLFYLIRLSAYVYFFVYVWNFTKHNLKHRNLLVDCLLGVSVVSAVFGWIQFFMIPDIKALFVYGWDIHLFRLVGTFLDPTFLGLVIVFGLILSISRFIDGRSWKILAIILFLLVSLAFTYSRASYVAFLAAAILIGFTQKRLKNITLLIIGLLIMLFLLPTAKNHTIELTRTFSIIARLDNYKETLQIIRRFPVFGVGFNNLCIARNRYIGVESFSSHACSGSDSSLLFILVTTGVIGFLIFLKLVLSIIVSLGKSNEVKVFTFSAVALFVHSLFSNSLFFPWVMGYMLILLAIVIKE